MELFCTAVSEVFYPRLPGSTYRLSSTYIHDKLYHEAESRTKYKIKFKKIHKKMKLNLITKIQAIMAGAATKMFHTSDGRACAAMHLCSSRARCLTANSPEVAAITNSML